MDRGQQDQYRDHGPGLAGGPGCFLSRKAGINKGLLSHQGLQGHGISLRITIGSGKGHNWWCVLYPSLCYTDAIHAVVPDSSKQTLSSLLAEDDYDALLSPLDRTKQPQQKPEVRVRFRLMDLFHKKS